MSYNFGDWRSEPSSVLFGDGKNIEIGENRKEVGGILSFQGLHKSIQPPKRDFRTFTPLSFDEQLVGNAVFTKRQG
ncbi:MAG: hypothetical protein RIC19_10145 [Phaeodactylibacter sp.]|uniref:hypothetical protein n=1 Tax=Phaeodactylibacter sp. TaxID=1940289 RepID=UPI0032EF0EAF